MPTVMRHRMGAIRHLAAKRMSHRHRTTALTASLSLALGIGAVAVVASHPAKPLLAHLSKAAETFASPGELLWWATLGGPFRGYPTGPAGYLVWVFGTALFWFFAGMLFLAIGRRVFSAARRCA